MEIFDCFIGMDNVVEVNSVELVGHIFVSEPANFVLEYCFASDSFDPGVYDFINLPSLLAIDLDQRWRRLNMSGEGVFLGGFELRDVECWVNILEGLRELDVVGLRTDFADYFVRAKVLLSKLLQRVSHPKEFCDDIDF